MEPDLVPLPFEAVPCAAPRSPHWPAVRHAYAVKHPNCAACGGAKMIQVHHIVPFAHDPLRELDTTNFITLCEDPDRLCHLRVGHCFSWSHFNPHVEEDAALSLKRIQERKES